MRLLVSKHNLGKWVAFYVYKKIREFAPNDSRPFILGLPTGSTPLDMYKQLIKFHKDRLLSFKHVITFNMDEYVGLSEDHAKSYRHYMFSNFFNHIDIPKTNINLLNGSAVDLNHECKIFEEKIASVGGMHLIVGGTGEDGHIAFNEPYSSLSSITRVKTLDYSTRMANSRFFENNLEKTPTMALTMGIKTILDAKEVLIMACGLHKSNAIANAVEGSISSICPISCLQMHKNALIICDEYAAFELRLKTMRYFESLKDEYYDLEQELSTEELTQ